MRRKCLFLGKKMISAVIACALALLPITPASAATARATTMKLEKTEGTVTLKTQNGSARKISNGMRLYNGNTLKTEKYSYAYVNLDNTKAVKLDQSSSATLRQSGKELELLVKSGKLFFNVSKPLTEKEQMNVRTSTMVTGIRGTCGVVEYVNVNKSKLYLIEGQVTLGFGENATTIQGGQTATVVLQEKQTSGGTEQPGDKPGDTDKPSETDKTGKEMEQKVMVEKMTEASIPPVALKEIVNNPVLQEKIEKTTELKIEKIEKALEQFEKEEAERKEQEKAEQEKENEKEETKEPEKKPEEESKTDSSSSGSSETYVPSTPSQATKTETVLTGAVSSGALKAAFQEYDRIHIKESNAFQLETSETLIIPNGKELILWNDQSVPATSTIRVGEGGTKALLCVAINDGSTSRNALSAGNIEVTAGSRLEDHGTLDCKSLSGGENAVLINNQELRVSGTMSLSNGSIYENHGYMSCADLNSAGGATIKNTDRMILSGTYTSKGMDTYSDSTDAALISKTASTAMSAGKMLMAAKDSSGKELYYYYAQCLCDNIISNMYLPSNATTGQVTWEFAKNALIPSGTNVERHDFIAELNAFELQVEGTLKLSGVSQIAGSGNATIRLKTGGNLTLEKQNSEASAVPYIKNTGNGCVIASDGGKLIWNDVGISISGVNGVASAIQNATDSDKMVKLPSWVTVKTGYLPIWKDNIITLQTMPSEFTSGTVTAAELYQSLSVHETVTVGQAVNANLSASDTVTVPAGKTLNILSKVTSSGSDRYSGGFYLEKSTQFTLEENATLNVESGGFFGGNGIITVKAGAKIDVKENGTLQADDIKLAAGSSITNNGLIDGGSITSEGNAAVTNNTLIRLANAYTTSGSKDTYTDTDNSALITSGASRALADDKLLACNRDQTRYCYATKLNTVVASYMNDGSWTFSKTAIVPSSVTLTNFSADMRTNQLEVQGDLTFTGTLNITGAGAQTIYLNGGIVTLGGIAVSGSINMIQNTTSGYAIGYSSGLLVWNDTSLTMKSTNPGTDCENIIQGYSTVSNSTTATYLRVLDGYGVKLSVETDKTGQAILQKSGSTG